MTNQPAPSTPKRHLPVRPLLSQLRRQAKELLRAALTGDPASLAEFDALGVKLRLADAQLVLARSFGVSSWTRLVQACEVADAIWEDDAERLRLFMVKHPQLLHEPVRAHEDNWGQPMSYAANLGRNAIIQMLHGLGANDYQHAFDRACLQGRLDTAQSLIAMGATLEPGAVMGPCETLNADGLAFLLEMGAEISDAEGNRLAPVGMILQTYARRPSGKHGCLEALVRHGFDLPSTPPMALHRGRLDLLEDHLRRDPGLFTAQFSHEDIYPLALGCSSDPTLALHGTPLAGGTLLHLAVDYDEKAIIDWILSQGGNPDAPATVDAEGFGGHTALFGTVVNQPFRAGRPGSGLIAAQLLEAGADPGVRASLKKELRFVADESLHEYHHVTPWEWGCRFQDQDWVNPEALSVVKPG